MDCPWNWTGIDRDVFVSCVAYCCFPDDDLKNKALHVVPK